jgi:hypothetical protein
LTSSHAIADTPSSGSSSTVSAANSPTAPATTPNRQPDSDRGTSDATTTARSTVTAPMPRLTPAGVRVSVVPVSVVPASARGGDHPPTHFSDTVFSCFSRQNPSDEAAPAAQ